MLLLKLILERHARGDGVRGGGAPGLGGLRPAQRHPEVAAARVQRDHLPEARPVLAVLRAALGAAAGDDGGAQTKTQTEGKAGRENGDGEGGNTSARGATGGATPRSASEPVFRGHTYTTRYDADEQQRELDRLLQMAVEESLAVSAN